MEVPVVIARQNLDGTEMEFANMLFEDSNNDALAYTECELEKLEVAADESNADTCGI